jgi:hypothetical protein
MKTHGHAVTYASSFIHFNSLNVRHFKIAQDTEIKNITSN